ncbi:MAG TPA: hypothetical protein VKM72_33620 [Thermoanaerobaculia bacterium]|nr:hypothetical protein [Thermoanaerobaculia bacterium]
MPQETTNSGKLGALQRLRVSLDANASDVPHLDGPRTRYGAIVTEAEEVAKQQAALIASKQEASKRLKSLLTEGERVAAGIRKFLKEHYGVSAEKLAEYGLKPFRGRRKPDAESPKPPATTDPDAPPPTSPPPVKPG